MLNTFAPESSVLMLLNISLFEQNGKAKRGHSLRGETVESSNTKQEGKEEEEKEDDGEKEEEEGGTQVV